jgi:hypothetical protein
MNGRRRQQVRIVGTDLGLVIRRRHGTDLDQADRRHRVEQTRVDVQSRRVDRWRAPGYRRIRDIGHRGDDDTVPDHHTTDERIAGHRVDRSAVNHERLGGCEPRKQQRQRQC